MCRFPERTLGARDESDVTVVSDALGRQTELLTGA